MNYNKQLIKELEARQDNRVKLFEELLKREEFSDLDYSAAEAFMDSVKELVDRKAKIVETLMATDINMI